MCPESELALACIVSKQLLKGEEVPPLPPPCMKGQAMFTIVWVGAVITRKGSSPRQVHAQPTFKKAKQGEWDTRRRRRREGRELKRVTMQHFTAG